ncbi:MAG: hypothetical protein II907_06360 [Firmicutes bacterium]|nr:hypothetical protein [Bacillota bacterium]MBQ6296013.1 hypothetical protein [Bacillota bacterium]
MYHIKNDKRCRQSAEAIADGFIELLSTKDFKDITISDIQRVSSVGRSTFYRLFDTIDDVVVYRIDTMLQEFGNDYNQKSFNDLCGESLFMILLHGEQWFNIVASGRMDLIVHSMRKGIETMMNSGQIPLPEQAEYRLAIFTGAAISLMAAWNEHGKKESIDELVGILERYLNVGALAG